MRRIAVILAMAMVFAGFRSDKNEQRAKEISDMKFGMFICWSYSTFYGKEWTPTLDKDASFFNASGCDTDQWCKLAKDAGMSYISFLSKHHDGFCLWDTETTSEKVTNSPLGIDVLAQLRKSCDKYGIKLALYFSEGDWNWPGAADGKGHAHGKGINPEMKKAQLKELCTQYGPIEFFWMDHAVGDGGLSHQETADWVHSFQPDCFVGFNHGEPAGRLSLRELGKPGPIGDANATKYNKEAEANNKGYLAAEFTYPILPPHEGGAMWFYSLPKHDSLCHPPEKIYNDYLGAVKYGNIFSVNIGPDYRGKIRDIDVKTLKEVGTLISEPKQPNIIFFIADDMYPHMFNSLPEGSGKNLTPNIDRLAGEGVFLTHQIVASPVCTPSRYNCLTGTYASRATNKEFINFTQKNEGQTVIQWNSFITPGKEKTMGNYFQELGYKTGFVGKNHVVESLSQIDQTQKPDLHADPNDPEVKASLEQRHSKLQEDIRRSGFDFADNLYHNNPRWLGVQALACQNMDWIAEGGLRFLETYPDDPTFLYFATTIPHHPLDAKHSFDADPRITPKGYLDNPPDVLPSRESLKTRIKEAGLSGSDRTNLLWMDDALGALLKKLEETGKIDNTIIVFFNDHGQHSKGTLYEGGIHSQCIIWKSGGFKIGNWCDIPVSNVDFLPTLLEYAGVENTAGICDGYSFKSALEGESYEPRESLFFELGFARAVVKGKYKYLAIRYPEYAKNASLEERTTMLNGYNEMRRSFGGKAVNFDPTLPYGHLEMFPGGGDAEKATYGNKSGFFDPDQLYDLEADSEEETNLANDADYEQVLKEMKAEMQKYLDQLPGKFGI